MPIIHQSYQRRGYLTCGGYGQLDVAMAECAVLYNAALQEWQDFWTWKQRGNQDTDKSITLYSQMKAITQVRSEDPYWRSVSLQIGRGVLIRLDRARRAFFRRVQSGQTPGYPRFKPRQHWHTIDLAEVTPGMVRHGKVKIKGLPTIHVKGKELPDSQTLKALRITKRGRRVTVSLTYAVEAVPMPPSKASIGIDMGISDRMALSNGESIDRRIVDRGGIADKQRRLPRCTKGSREWKNRARILANAQGRERVCNRNGRASRCQRSRQERPEPGNTGSYLGSDSESTDLQGRMGR